MDKLVMGCQHDTKLSQAPHKCQSASGDFQIREHLHDVHHYHPQEISERVQMAKTQCRTQGVRFTPLRQQIYELILQSNRPIGAYDLITELQQQRQQKTESDSNSIKNVAPPTIYRSLEFLLQQGLIHQLTSLNAYVPCCHPRAQHTAAFLICEQCQGVQECSSLPVNEIMEFAQQDMNFLVTRSVIELRGRCESCQTAV